MSLFDVEPVDPRLEAETTRVKLVVAYDGAGFHGFWPNDGVPTVGGTLIAAIEQVLTHTIEMTCAGRTDTGVHAWGQVVTFDAFTETLDLERLQPSVNKLCGPAVVVREATEVHADFDARGSATAGPTATRCSTGLPRPLPARHDLARARAARPAGHDPGLRPAHRLPRLLQLLSPAQGARGPRPGLAHPPGDRRPAGSTGDGLLRFEISANAFCHQMVRSIVGLLVDVGRGRSRAGDVLGIIRAQDRQVAPSPAPPQGLCLWSVAY